MAVIAKTGPFQRYDFTNEATTEASRAEARRVGLEMLFSEYEGTTGSIVVLDRRTRAVTADIHGRRDLAEYRTAIDAALAPAAMPSAGP